VPGHKRKLAFVDGRMIVSMGGRKIASAVKYHCLVSKSGIVSVGVRNIVSMNGRRIISVDERKLVSVIKYHEVLLSVCRIHPKS
jgi:hypothetical protein